MIDRETAIEIARSRAAENGWAFAEPVQVGHRRGWFGQSNRFEIETNAGKLGTKSRFTIHAKTSEVLSEGYLPR
jgi:hypothetical protein